MASIESIHPPEMFADTDFQPSGFSHISTFPETKEGYVVERRKVGYHPPCELIIKVQERLERGDTAIHEIRTAQQELAADTKEMLDILHGAKTFFKVAKWVGSVVAWFTPVVAVWVAWKGIGK